MTDIVIIDYEMSNLHSVKRALDFFKINSKVSSDPKEILNSKLAILPGVGAFPEAMNKLKGLNLINAIKEFINLEKPFVGICLGMQLLFENSEEFGNNEGLGIIKGSVKKFDNDTNFKVPHIGWNKIKKSNNKFDYEIIDFKNFSNIMYFVHSYYVKPESNDIIMSYTDYCNMNFCSSIKHKNIFAFQFHPEKSGLGGLNIYKNLKNFLDAK